MNSSIIPLVLTYNLQSSPISNESKHVRREKVSPPVRPKSGYDTPSRGNKTNKVHINLARTKLDNTSDDEAAADDDDDDYDGEDEDGEDFLKAFRLNNIVNALKSTSSTLSPPLPLMKFNEEVDKKAKTINGIDIPYIDINAMIPEVNSEGRDPLFQPLRPQVLSKWFLLRCGLESRLLSNGGKSETLDVSNHSDTVNIDTSKVSKVKVYKCSAFGFNEDDSDSDNDDNHALRALLYVNHLRFDSNFESGNLKASYRLYGRENVLFQRHLDGLEHGNHCIPLDVHQEYDLILRNDINTSGNIQWYYFAVTTPASTHIYPLTVRLNIINLQKNDSLYNYGMKPVVFSSNKPSLGWHHAGSDICYYNNGTKYGRKRIKYRYTLAFTYTFTDPDEKVFFAHCFPYTYSDLQIYLAKLEKDERVSNIMHRNLLCTTLGGNRCDLLTITNKSTDQSESNRKPSIIISARIHPGESNSSYMMQGVIDSLVADTPEADILRKHFVFKIIPMLNPDGVVHGNYRCCLAGTDLNRRYLDAYPSVHANIIAMKKLVLTTHQRRGVLLYLDLHGHSKKKNSFLYGCDLLQVPGKLLTSYFAGFSPEKVDMQRVYTRIFPALLCSISNVNNNTKNNLHKGYFSFKDCRFGVGKNKLGTGRVVSWRDLRVPGSYTIELSFCGTGISDGDKTIKKGETIWQRGRQLLNDVKKPISGDFNEYIRDVYLEVIGSIDTDHKIKLLNVIDDQLNNAFHYSRKDLQSMGADLVTTIFHFSNLGDVKDLSLCELPIKISGKIRPAYSNMQRGSFASRESFSSINSGELSNSDSTVSGMDVMSTAKEIGGQNISSVQVVASDIDYNGYDTVYRPLLRPGIYSNDAIKQIIDNRKVSSDPKSNPSLRFSCEVAIRNALCNTSKFIKFQHKIDISDSFIESFANYEEVESDGSDSDPSVDNIPVAKLLASQKLSFKKVGSKGDLLSTLNKIITKKAKKEKKHYEESVNVLPAQVPISTVQSVPVSSFKDSTEPTRIKLNIKPSTSLPRKRREVPAAPSSSGPVYRMTTEVDRPQIVPIIIKNMQLDSSYDSLKIPIPKDLRAAKKPQSANGIRRSSDKVSSSLQTMGGNVMMLHGIGDERTSSWHSSTKSLHHVKESSVNVSKDTISTKSVLRGVVTRRLSEPLI